MDRDQDALAGDVLIKKIEPDASAHKQRPAQSLAQHGQLHGALAVKAAPPAQAENLAGYRQDADAAEGKEHGQRDDDGCHIQNMLEHRVIGKKSLHTTTFTHESGGEKARGMPQALEKEGTGTLCLKKRIVARGRHALGKKIKKFSNFFLENGAAQG